MFLPKQNPQALQQSQQSQQVEQFKPSDRYRQFRSNADSFFLFGCVSMGMLAVGLARISPNHRCW
ncbi:MAG: hypothetical protein HC786_22050 [Richelia sp. CSU_2_1]|nr:hypothetical protein [Richelia sp. CSU_2_1]